MLGFISAAGIVVLLLYLTTIPKEIVEYKNIDKELEDSLKSLVKALEVRDDMLAGIKPFTPDELYEVPPLLTLNSSVFDYSRTPISQEELQKLKEYINKQIGPIPHKPMDKD